MKEIIEVPWLPLMILGLIGIGLLWAGLKLSNPEWDEKKDALGVKYSERSLFLLLNGVLLILVAAIAVVVKVIL
jgi:TRAP-type C4-dicarboxylate transport system permease small subunit